MSIDALLDYRQQVQNELTDNILPFYINHAIDRQHGGFYGYISNNLTLRPDAPKALIQNSRILWTFSHAYRILGNPNYLKLADRAFQYLQDYFWDDEHSGLYWLLDYQGQPQDTTKMGYGLAFGIYGFSEYFLAGGNQASLDKAIALYQLIEQHLLDNTHGGYFEAGQRDWSPHHGESVDHNLAAKTMNTHLHILEAYTNLLRAWDAPELRTRLKKVIEITLNHIVDIDTGHFKLHFDATWRPLNSHISYGHDIEGSWLLVEAAEVLGNVELLPTVQRVALKMAEATLNEGLDLDGGLFYEGDPSGITDDNKDWWPQAEAMIGFLNAFQLSGENRYLKASLNCWEFTKNTIVDKQYGEWIWGVDRQGLLYSDEKTGPWKAPYHNGRACLEIMQRISTLYPE